MENDFIFSSREFQNNPSNSNSLIKIGNYSNSKDAFEKMEVLTKKTAKELDKKLQKISNFNNFINYQIEKTSEREVYKYL